MPLWGRPSKPPGVEHEVTSTHVIIPRNRREVEIDYIESAPKWSVDKWREITGGWQPFQVIAVSLIYDKSQEERNETCRYLAQLTACNPREELWLQFALNLNSLSEDTLRKVSTAIWANIRQGVYKDRYGITVATQMIDIHFPIERKLERR